MIKSTKCLFIQPNFVPSPEKHDNLNYDVAAESKLLKTSRPVLFMWGKKARFLRKKVAKKKKKVYKKENKLCERRSQNHLSGIGLSRRSREIRALLLLALLLSLRRSSKRRDAKRHICSTSYIDISKSRTRCRALDRVATVNVNVLRSTLTYVPQAH